MERKKYLEIVKNKKMIKNYNGIPISIPNTISKDAKEYYISYNPSSRNYGCSTTCLHINSTSQFLILNGNHKEEFSKCITLEESLKYFYDNIEKANTKSEHGRIFKIVPSGKAKYIKGGY